MNSTDNNYSYVSKLTEYMVTDILTEESSIQKVIGIYSGRFQPAGLHHYKTYKWFEKQFDEAWVATSDKTNSIDSPLDYNAKKLIWAKHGVRNISKVKNPYKAEEILKKHDEKTTSAVFLVGKKDADRLSKGKFFRPWEGKAEVGYRDGAYLMIAPHVSIKVLGKEVSGTRIRELLGKTTFDQDTKKTAFKELFGWYDEKIFKYLTKKFGTLFENEEIFENFLNEYPKFEKLVETLPGILNEISSISSLGKSMVDDGPSGFYTSGNYRKFANNDATDIGYDVLNYLLGKNNVGQDRDYRHFGEYSGPVPAVSYYPAGAIDVGSPTNQINIEETLKAYNAWFNFIKEVAETTGFKLVDFIGAEDSIRKKDEQGDENLKTDNVIDIEKNEKQDKIKIGVHGQVSEGKLLSEGGAAGHMSHPFDDKDLTFADLKEMIRRSLAGELNVEKEVTEKLDGQNLMFSWKDGKLVSARNQGHLKNAGAAAPDVTQFENIFADRPENIRDAFVSAVKDLESAISKLSDAQKNKVFKEGERFMNIEVMTPATQNVIPQNVDMLVFHGTQAYNSAGKPVSEDSDGNDITGELKDSARMLSGMLKQINADVQSRYSLNAPIVVELPKSKTFGDSFAKYSAMLDKLKKEFKLKDNDKVMKYHDAWWRNLLNKQQSKLKEVFPAKVYEALIGRWAYNDKSNKITTIRMDLSEQPKLKDWVNKFEKEDIVKQFEKNMWPFQFIFLKLGAEVLQNVKGFVAAGGSDDIAKALDAHTKTLKAKKISSVESPDKFKKDIAKLFKNLDRLTAIGGTKVIAPSEGVVFQYKGGTYKLTGTFAPINQIMGIMRF
jgi:hypothetical protein